MTWKRLHRPLLWPNRPRFTCRTRNTSEFNFSQLKLEELILAHLHGAFCSEILSQERQGEIIPFLTDKNGLLVRTENHSTQIVVAHTIKQPVLTWSRYPVLTGHYGGRKIYYKVKQQFNWPALAADCYDIMHDCLDCARNILTLHKNVVALKLLPSTAPLESVCIYIQTHAYRTCTPLHTIENGSIYIDSLYRLSPSRHSKRGLDAIR